MCGYSLWLQNFLEPKGSTGDTCWMSVWLLWLCLSFMIPISFSWLPTASSFLDGSSILLPRRLTQSQPCVSQYDMVPTQAHVNWTVFHSNTEIPSLNFTSGSCYLPTWWSPASRHAHPSTFHTNAVSSALGPPKKLTLKSIKREENIHKTKQFKGLGGSWIEHLSGMLKALDSTPKNLTNVSQLLHILAPSNCSKTTKITLAKIIFFQ